MTDHLLPTGDGHTELSDEDRLGLLPSYIATRGELYDAEQRNIATALLAAAPSTDRLLHDAHLRKLHRSMFGQVWSWAGRYRLREANIGIDPIHITAGVRSLVHDARAWVDHATFDADELAVRFHHRLVAIHPFPNGNGRHGRVAADQLATGLGRPPFSWGARLSVGTEELRTSYRRALQRADAGDVEELTAFARS